MRTLRFVITALILSSVPVWACPPNLPATPRPASFFVPTADCLGWIPVTNPAAPVEVPAPPPYGVTASLQGVTQGILTAYEGGTFVSSSSGLRTMQGWAVDCEFGSMPPTITVMEKKPDGSLRQVPTDYYFDTGQSRPDVQAFVGGSCPNVYNVPLADGRRGGANDRFGWSVQLRSPITEIGVHTLTIIWEWNARAHHASGSVSVPITVQ